MNFIQRKCDCHGVVKFNKWLLKNSRPGNLKICRRFPVLVVTYLCTDYGIHQEISKPMKIRIKGDSIRFRLTRTEVEDLCEHGYLKEVTHLDESTFTYAVKSMDSTGMKARFENNCITLHVSKQLLKGWESNERVGFEQVEGDGASSPLHLLLEKDFVCLDRRLEDQSDNYPNPKLQKEQDPV